MDPKTRSLTWALKAHDRKLYASRDTHGKIHVYRERLIFDAMEWQGQRLLVLRKEPFYLFSLTTDFKAQSPQADWGIEPVMLHLREGDLWNQPDLGEKLIESYEKADRKKEKDFHSQNEDFFREFRPAFKKAFSDVNTSTLAKIDRRRSNKWQ